jgi:hypothetical protein
VTILPPFLKRLLAPDTPIGRRIFELALFGLLIGGCAWCMYTNTVPYGVKVIATFIFVAGLLVAVGILLSILVTILVKDIQKDKP